MSLMLFISTKMSFNNNENYAIYTQLGNEDNSTIFPHTTYIYIVT